MRRLACLVTTGLVVLLVALSPAVASGAVHSVGPAGATQPGRLKITIGSMSPRVVSANDTAVTVTGTLTNVGDRRIDQLEVRLQLGDAVTSENELRSAAGTVPTEQVPPFEPIDGSPGPGQSLPWSITVPLTGAHSLDITQPGVYSLVVNINGTPTDGGQTRLAAVHLLLPVLAAPHGPPVGKPASPARISVLWPLVDTRPRLVGSSAAGVVLADDALAGELAPGGRLYGLVDSVATVEAASPTDSALPASLCFAIDPELLAAVTGMTAGYQVRTPTGGMIAGHGEAVAKQWLARLRQVTSGHCVLALPYADADLVALSHADATDLMSLALRQSAALAHDLPAAQLITNVVWPADGTVDNSAMAALAKLGVGTALLASTATEPAGDTTAAIPASDTRALAVDGPTSAALTAGGSPADVTAGVATPVDEHAVATQSGLATLLYRALFDTANRQLLVAPPRRWNAPESELVEFLGTAQNLFTSQSATPLGLTALIGSTGGGSATLNYPPAAAGAEVPGAVTDAAVRLDGQLNDLLGAMNADHATPIDPGTLIDPLRLGLLGGMSSAWRGNPTGGDALGMVNLVRADQRTITGMVSVQQSELTISLAAKDSKVPLSVHNSLPVDINVRLSLSAESGLQATAVEPIRIPANNSYTAFIPVRVTRSGRFSVQTVLTTTGGTALGTTARVEIVSNAYGTIILVVTSIAFGALVLLSGRRIYRRIRAARQASTAAAPSPSPPASAGG
ncbi:MAG TPA: DUF6049 family protein [Pseudonocardiaceae bacterium]|nr:DUF6049 family protein [Pseudonocardiaceae bacterium]